MQSDPSTSKHNFAQARFHVPTWCTHCKLFVRNPFGMQGYHCDKCHAQIHKDCLAAASGTPCGEQSTCTATVGQIAPYSPTQNSRRP